MLTNRGDQTKIQVFLHVEPPTKPYQYPCSRCETHWCIWLGCGALTNAYQLTVLAVPHSRTLLPIITGRVININSVHNWQDTHMITGTILWILIVGLLAYAAYLKADINRWK